MPPLWWLLALLVYAGLTAATAPGPPTWPDGTVLSVSGLGLGCVYLQWPSAENNVYQMIGYQVLISTFLGPSGFVPDLLFDGTGFPLLQEYVVCDLRPGGAYQFFILALNQDPNTFQIYTSDYLARRFTLVKALTGLDPTTLDVSSHFQTVAGISSQFSITGIQPNTGLPQTIGPVCSVSQDASCIPGRTFVVYMQPVCALTVLNNDCSALRASDPAWTDPSVAFDPMNNGTYIANYKGEKAGNFSLIVKAVTPGQLLGLYWDNAFFSGDPVNTKLSPNIDMNWNATNPPFQWVVEYLSVRWAGFLNPISSGKYTFVCIADTFCDLWINNIQIIFSNQTRCLNGCNATAPLSLERAVYYHIRVEYVSGMSGTSSVRLKWKHEGDGNLIAVPSEVFSHGAYISGSPFSVTVVPGPIVASASFVYGSEEAMYRPAVGKKYTLFVQGADMYGNPCIDYDPHDVITADIKLAWSLRIVQTLSSEKIHSNCVYAFRFTHSHPGEYLLSVYVNGNPVANQPVVQSVSAGPVTSLRARRVPPAPSVNVSFTVELNPLDISGNLIPAEDVDANSLSISYRFYKNPALVSSANQCSSRSNVTWFIYCWGEEFVYIDDSLLNAVSPFSLYGPVDELLSLSLRPLIAGNYLLAISLGDTLIHPNSPLSIIVGTGSDETNPVSPALSLVSFTQPSSSAEVVAYDTTIGARVLLRDFFGNVLTDRPNASVFLNLMLNGTNQSAGAFPCAYVTGKYYACTGYSNLTGTVAVTVFVNGQRASVTQGSPPTDTICIGTAVCGTKRCPCMQNRTPAIRLLEVVSGD